MRGIFLAAALVPVVAGAAPYRPTEDAQVLERVAPGRQRLPVTADLNSAVTEARSFIERARAEGDPRWLGFAEGVLQPWWAQAAPPPSVRLLRATLLQSRHRFAEALADLDAIPTGDTAYPQAQLTRATVLRVQGRYAEAAEACARLVGRTDDFIATLCETAVKGLRGQLGSAVKDLRALENFSASRPSALRGWLAAELAEALERSGDPAGAENIYRTALSTSEDLNLRAAYADFLLAQYRSAEVLDLLRSVTQVEALALRLLLAQQAMEKPDPKLQARLAETYAAARRRGEQPHLREEALFTLHIRGDAQHALRLAQENWNDQREPPDALLLAQAALTAGQPQVLEALREWVRTTGYEDARLQDLLPP